MKTRVCIVAALCLFVPGLPSAWPQDAKCQDRDEIGRLKRQIEKLQDQIKKLENVIEGTAQPINLGRTSLAAVTASSVNGSRALDNVFYGVPNAFDDGNNWHNQINYTYWLSSGEPGPWLEVHFDVPVSVTSIHVQNGPAFTARLVFAKGGEKALPAADSEVKFAALENGVKTVRLTFAAQASANVTVHEVRILGHVPPGNQYTVGRPRVQSDATNALLASQQALADWQTQLLRATRHEQQEKERAFVFTYFHNNMPILRVSVRKHDSVLTVTPLVRLTPIIEQENK
ncbi:MAG: hypothetical protein L0215_14000 [Gemmataceae bacterium]|nr:hypothetical protein [Gemmataceae bacterium]